VMEGMSFFASRRSKHYREFGIIERERVPKFLIDCFLARILHTTESSQSSNCYEVALSTDVGGETMARTYLAPDATYHGAQPQLAPNGKWVGGKPQLAPDGTWVGGKPQLAPDGTWVGGKPHLAPNGTWVGGKPVLAPNGEWVGDGTA
jgi:hypothetical protein